MPSDARPRHEALRVDPVWSTIREEAAELTMYTSCEPCSMCAGAIARSGLGRVVYALSGEQLGEIRPADAPSPLFPWTADGPHLRDEAVVPVVGYY